MVFGPVAPAGVAGGLPGALGRMPLRPWDPTTEAGFLGSPCIEGWGAMFCPYHMPGAGMTLPDAMGRRAGGVAVEAGLETGAGANAGAIR